MRVDRKHTAYHEAGHAVIALVLGYDVSKVTIRAAYSYLGIARISNERCGSPGSTEVQARVDSEVDLVGHICIGLAGPLAEKLVNHSAELIAYGARVDWERAQRRARRINRRQAEALIHALMKETKTLVQQHRKAIARVAAALLDRETLRGDEIRQLVEVVS